MPIAKLDQHTIEQIAAGEVIESPVSIVKELVENSIDAKARNITVEIKNGGKTYIRVTDDGVGIAKDDLALAFEKHTTSKIVKFEDLYDIYSLGFRGEALSSIVSVSDVSAISKTKDSKLGSKIDFKESHPKIKSIATNDGTSIEVSNLFKNLPVRQKFLRSDTIESNQISKLMYSLAIGYPDVSIKFIKDGRVEFKTNINDSYDVKISKLLDDNLADNLLEISARNDIYKITGLISTANYYRGSRSLQYIFVNNRLIDNSLITDTIEREYRSYIPSQRFPAFFIFIETNPKNLDVNIHPNKRKIKFNYEDELTHLLSTSIKNRLYESKSPDQFKVIENTNNEIADFSDYSSLLDKYASFNIVREEASSYENNEFFDESLDISNTFVKETNQKIENYEAPHSFIEDSPKYSYLTSIFGRYSIFNKSHDEIIVLDHRRADEAIKYDEFMKQFNESSIFSQILLNPIIINLKADDKIKFNQKKEYINKLGLDVDLYSENQVIIRSIPQIFDVPVDHSFFYDLLDINYESDLFNKSIYKFIKSNSFRKGAQIGEAEAIALIKDVYQLDNPYKTYDGKAIMIVIHKDQLEKYFD